ncbi:HAD family hydrolase [Methanocella sp. CWC-04]|uniref:HAD family hydrolase n=1 Tax=Methanooceanicella nereidis TaxID=2052831 RepID=A0AAP2RFX7_9EURY|nr:HAD family hydrolase [Methanocella sp. CWC-04]
MITTILFDIYGTMIDISTDENNIMPYETMSKWLEYKSIYLTPDQLKWFYHEEFSKRIGTKEERERVEEDIFKEIMEEYEMRVREEREIHRDADVREVFKSIILKFTTPPPDELEHLALDLSHLFRATTRKKIFIYPTVKPALDQLQRRYRLGIVSNAQEAFTIPELRLFGLDPYFETIVLSSMVGAKKPNSRIFLQALKNLDIKPENAVFVGNDLKADIMGASKLGIKTIYLSDKSLSNIKGYKPNAVIANVNMFEVLKYVDMWNATESKKT